MTIATLSKDNTMPHIANMLDIHHFVFKASTLPTIAEMKALTRSIASQVTMSKGKRNGLINDLWDLHELAWSTSRD